eukprot:jgi/Undpi1/14136/HiC_scaffold_9.g03787.m1
MSAPGNGGDSRGRKRRLNSDQDRATPSLETSSTATAMDQNRLSFPQFSVPERPARRRANNPDGNGGRGSGSTGNKDSDDYDPYGVGDDEFDAVDLPNDTMATVLSLQKEFYGAIRSHPPRKNSASSSSCSIEGADGSSSARLGGGGERTGIVLQHQIYTVLENRTAVDLELTSMRKENVIRTFRLGTGREDWGVLSTDHYFRVIRNLLGTTQAADGEGGGHGGGSVDGNSGRQGPADGTPAKRTGQASLERDVLERLVKSNARAYVSQAQVSNAMQEVLRDRDNHVVGGDTGTAAVVAAAEAAAVAAKGGDGSARGFFVAGGGGRGAKHRKKRKPNSRAEGMQEDEDDENEEPDLWILKRKREEVLSLISKLIRAGFLLPRRDVAREEAYWFSMPQLGKVIASISRGRNAVVGALKRTRYKEMRRSALEAKNPAKATGLPVSFHLRDLLGLGMIRELDTPSGAFLRLAPDS